MKTQVLAGLCVMLGSGCPSSESDSPDGGSRDGPTGDGAMVVTDAPATGSDTVDGALEAGDPEVWLQQCFSGLRMAVGGFQDASRKSTDGRYVMRLALETGDRLGTSGTVSWGPMRLGLVTPDRRICVTDETLLGYRVSHHNCSDLLSVTSDGRRYIISNPDTAVSYTDSTRFRRRASLAVFEGDVMVLGPITLDTSACHRSTGGSCRSGGPCDTDLEDP